MQHLLERLQPGDEIRVGDAAAETGLDPSMCAMVLGALARVDLFTPLADGVFVRRRILDALERLPGTPDPPV
jgi:hypothetical protein